MRSFRLVTVAALSALLTACYWPQNYTLNVKVGKDGTVDLNYAGQLVSIMPRMSRAEAAQKGKKLSSKDLAELEAMNKETEKEFKKAEGFKEVKYLGNDTFAVKIVDKHTLKDGEEYKPLMDLLLIRKVGKKVFIKAQRVEANDMEQLKALNLTARGQINVTTDAKVISSNVSKSGIFGKTYRWKMDKLGATAPAMTIMLP